MAPDETVLHFISFAKYWLLHSMGRCNNPYDSGGLWGVCNDRYGATGAFGGTEACIVGQPGESLCDICRALNELVAPMFGVLEANGGSYRPPPMYGQDGRKIDREKRLQNGCLHAPLVRHVVYWCRGGDGILALDTEFSADHDHGRHRAFNTLEV